MKPGILEIYGIALTLLVTTALFLFTTPFGALSTCRIFPLLSAFGLTVISLLLRCSVWVLLAAAAVPDLERTDPARPERAQKSEHTGNSVPSMGNAFSYRDLFEVSVISLIGMLTPMRLGTDLLRSVYGKQRLGIGFENTAAASILTREFKLHTSLFLAVGLVLAACFQPNLLKATAWSIAGLLFALACFISLRTDLAGRLAKRLRADSFTDAARMLHQKTGRARRRLIYSIFALGFLTEWASLHFCFRALDIDAAPLSTFATYLILYFLSTTPLLPQGEGVVETGAFILLRMMHVPTGQAGALIVIWNCVRILTPPLLSALLSLTLISRFGRAPSLQSPSA